MNDLEYRRNQLKALQNDELNLEDVSGAISITDLTYTNFKSDLTGALKLYKKELAAAPKGLYAVVSNKDLPDAKPGVIFCLKQHKEVAVESNSLAPYILLYVTENGEAFIHYTHAKKILDAYRKLANSKQEIDDKAVNLFNEETNNAVNMEVYQDLLKQSINIIKDKQEEMGIESLFSFGANTLQAELDLSDNDIELISFLVVKDESDE